MFYASDNMSVSHMSTRFSLSLENGQADAGRDGQSRVARSFSQARTVTGENPFFCSADYEQDWQPHRVDPYSVISDDHT